MVDEDAIAAAEVIFDANALDHDEAIKAVLISFAMIQAMYQKAVDEYGPASAQALHLRQTLQRAGDTARRLTGTENGVMDG